MALAVTELPAGFWSYVHRDDEAERGRILNLCTLIQEEFGLLTGRELEMFTDRSGIAWGDKWRTTINDALTETTFLIAVVTPRFVESEECRSELLAFTTNARARGVAELLFPILYADVDGLDENSLDEVKAAIAQTEYKPFTDLRLLDENSSEYRTAVNEMARRLIEIANTVAERAEAVTDQVPVNLSPGSPSASQRQGRSPEEQPGFIDAINAVGRQLPEWQQTINHFVALMNEVGAITTDYTPKMLAAAKQGSGPQIVVADEYAGTLRPVAEEFRDTGARYVEQALEVSENMIVILDQLSFRSTREPLDDATTQFLNEMAGLVEAGRTSAVSVEDFQGTVRDTSRLSRSIRRVLKFVDEGAQSFLDAQELLGDWERRIRKALGEDAEDGDQ